MPHNEVDKDFHLSSPEEISARCSEKPARVLHPYKKITGMGLIARAKKKSRDRLYAYSLLAFLVILFLKKDLLSSA